MTNQEINKEFIQKIIDTPGIFVSVGCGMCQLEQQLIKANKIVICIDPNNYDMTDRYLVGKNRVMQPHYKFVLDLLKAKPAVRGKVNLILEHPLPDYCLYDILAILRLEPKKIFLYYMKQGGSGSWLLHRFLRKNGVNTSGKLKTDISIFRLNNISPSICPIKYRYKQQYESSQGVHTYSILERQELLTQVYSSDYPLVDKEEFVLLDSQNVMENYLNCFNYLTSLKAI